MKMKILDFPQKISSIRLFSDEYESDGTIFYHGTNAIYSSQIEQFGLFPNHKPLTNYFYNIYNIADLIYSFSNENKNYFDFNQTVIQAFSYFKDFMRISFSAVSICAADYSIGNNSGGQGLRHLLNLKEAITNLDFSKLDNCSLDISDIEKRHFVELNGAIEKLKNSNGVIYTIKFDSTDIIDLSYCNHCFHSVLLCTKHVAPSKFVAKMIIPKNAQIPRTLIDLGNKETIELVNYNKSTPFIRQVQEANFKRNDIRKVINGNCTSD
jgi:hypothetical protein